MKRRNFLKSFARGDQGGPATEAALLLALVAAIAGFGMVFLGDALSNFYKGAGEVLNSATMSDQFESTTRPSDQ